MRISIDYLRVLMILANLGLAMGLAGYYAKSMGFPPFERESTGSDVKIIPPADFSKTTGGTGPTTNPAHLVTSAAMWLCPTPPAIPKGPGGDENGGEEGKEEESTEEPTETGPLGEKGWEYVSGIYDLEDPKNTIVFLKKKQETPSSRSSSARARYQRSRASSSRASSVRRRSPRVNPNDFISFRLGPPWRVQDEELELDFYPVSADPGQFVYAVWVGKGVPLKRYRLPREVATQYEKKGRIELAPREEEDEEKEGEGEEEEEKHFKWREDDYKDVTAEEYRHFLTHGQEVGDVREGAPPRRVGPPSARGQRTRINRPTSSASSRSSSVTRRSGPYKDPKKRAEALKKANEAIKKMKMDPKDRKQLQDALAKPPEKN